MNKLMKKMQDKIEGVLDPNSRQSQFSSAAPANAAPYPNLSEPPPPRLIYRFRKQRGVNLGSWFTLENWLTPSLFQHASSPKSSELDVLKGMSTNNAAKTMLEHHWDAFINEGVWKWMVAHGINTVRIPISYYHFLPGHPDPNVRCLMAGTDYEKYADVYVNSWTYVVSAIQTAAAHNIGVLIDLHAAPGAQNTDSHSGLSTGKAGLWSSDKWQRRTIDILVAMAQNIVGFDNVVGLELLNEPKNSNRLQSWYDEAIGAIQRVNPECAVLPIYVSDAWDTNWYSQYVSKHAQNGTFVVLDHHLYRCFAPSDHARSATEHARDVHPSVPGESSSMLERASGAAGQSLIIGEWSAAMNPASMSSYPSEEAKRAASSEWGYSQWEAYEKYCAGYFFWTLKKEGGPDTGWCFYTAVEQGVMPPFLDRTKAAFGNHTIDSLRDRGAHESQNALSQHSNWWAQNSSDPNKFEHWRFEQGYNKGWEDALAFYFGMTDAGLVGSEIGFLGKWKRVRTEGHRIERGNSEMVWEFEHGFEQAVRKFSEVVSH